MLFFLHLRRLLRSNILDLIYYFQTVEREFRRMEKIISKITQNIISQNIIDENQRDIFSYLLLSVIMNLFSAVIMISIGSIVVSLWKSLIFTATLIFLRSYTGGYHASSPGRCFLSSLFIVIFFLSISQVIKSIMLILIATILSSLIILIYAPANNASIHLDELEIKALRQHIFIRVLLTIVFICVFLTFDLSSASCISCSMIAVAILLVPKSKV